MVNEINKPPSEDNLILGERLMATNRQLQQMQEEHRQLLLEMEELRQRAEYLTSLGAQQQTQQRRTSHAIDNNNNNVNTVTVDEENVSSTNATLQETVSESNVIVPTEPANQVSTGEKVNLNEATSETVENTKTPDAETKTDNNDPDSAEYIQQKIAEIASLKAQYKRVQNLITTTNMIEQHLTPKEDKQENIVKSNQLKNDEDVKNTVDKSDDKETTPSSHLDEQNQLEMLSEQMANAIANENDELIGTMLTMFNDFTTDLRGQAESLRSERERIKALKEEIIQKRRQT